MALEIVKNKSYDSVDELFEENSTLEFKEIDGFKPGRSAWIVSLLAGDLLDWYEADDSPEKKREASLRLIARSLVKVTKDKDGKIISHEHISGDGDVPKFRKLRAAVTTTMANAILEFNNLNPKKAGAAKND